MGLRQSMHDKGPYAIRELHTGLLLFFGRRSRFLLVIIAVLFELGLAAYVDAKLAV